MPVVQRERELTFASSLALIENWRYVVSDYSGAQQSWERSSMIQSFGSTNSLFRRTSEKRPGVLQMEANRGMKVWSPFHLRLEEDGGCQLDEVASSL